VEPRPPQREVRHRVPRHASQPHTDDNTFTGGYPLIFDPTNTAPAWYDFNAYDQVGNAFGSFLLGDVYNAETNNPDNEYGRRKGVLVVRRAMTSR